MLEVQHLSKTYGSGEAAVRVVDDLTFTVKEGEFVCIVGPSGCGKTTLLKMISGLMPATSGEASFDGELIAGVPETLALVFQEYTRSLLPWLTVSENIALPIKKKHKREDCERLTREALHAVGLDSFSDHYPWQLSGGMQQRVAIARALAYHPKVLLMDEPFASVDAQTRSDLEDLMLGLRAQFGITVVLVTHDIDESVYLADRVVVLGPSPTRVVEIVDINLPQPRDQITTKELHEFANLRGHVMRLIKQRVDSRNGAATLS
ncbi:ABC transporter ATP-binding protein [Arthrobacter sp. CAU 1506]|uniref:ABC transporter ATP-binding protein n=1 Tax=Arthrobacter sp. CAU 1506 TaxID=2560052 RepID=UPI00145D6000|nr:ABC transporter ATP-binding protein [Arthrobacter sp. CAU 1506]